MPDDQLAALCEAHANPFIMDGPTASSVACERLENAVRSKSPLSLLRVGDGEGNAIGMTKHDPNDAQLKTFMTRFHGHNGRAISLDDALVFCHQVKHALTAADIIGVRFARSPELATIERGFGRGWPHAVLGILYAREFLQDGLVEGFLRRKFITSAWIHLDLIPFLTHIFTLAENIIVITGRSELKQQFHARLGSRLKDFISVPVQGFAPQSEADSHHGGVFPKILDYLRRDLSGTLLVVGAGLFGKIYCNTARMNGAVASDLGSAVDILAGHETRPIHASYDFSGARWL